jgi:hypothetical protein
VGYGDFYPITICGRFIALLAVLLGVLLLSGIFSALNAFVTLSAMDIRLINYIDLTACKKDRIHWAVVSIQRAWRWWWVRFVHGRRIYLTLLVTWEDK